MLPSVGSTQALNGCRQLGEEPAECEVEHLSGSREAQATSAFFEEFEAEVFGQFGDTAAHSSMGQGKAVGGGADRPKARRVSNARKSSNEGISDRFIDHTISPIKHKNDLFFCKL
jgi:hypothetical protein